MTSLQKPILSIDEILACGYSFSFTHLLWSEFGGSIIFQSSDICWKCIRVELKHTENGF